MNKRYEILMNNIKIGEVDKMTQVHLMIGCTRQHWYHTIIKKIIDGGFPYKKNNYKIVDKLNPI